MDLNLHLDFCFSPAAGIILAAGWTPAPTSDLVLHAGHASVAPQQVMRFARRDLRSLAPMGFVAVFDLSVAPGASDPSEDLFLGLGRQYLPVTAERLNADLRKLIEIGVDETFYALLRLLAQGHLPLPPGPARAGMAARILSVPPLPREAETHGLGIDRAMVGPDGQGVCAGWFMPASLSAEPLTGLVIADGQISRLAMMPGSIPRTDLHPYAGRYAFTGRDGWAAGFRLAGAVTGPVQIVLMLPGQMTSAGVIQTLDPVPPEQVAKGLLQTMQALDDGALSRDLHRATLPVDGPPPPEPVQPDADAPLLLILDHDLADMDLRDVLRRCAAAVGRPVLLHLLRPSLTEALSAAVAGAVRETGTPLRLTGCALRPSEGAAAGLALYARSSVLFHLDVAALLDQAGGAGLTLAVLDPLAGLPGGGGGGDLARRFAQDHAPFACLGPASMLLAALARSGSAFLTPEARMRQLAEALLAQDGAQLIPAHGPGFSAGHQGPFCQPLIEGVGWHEFDARSARLIGADAP